MQSIHLSVQGAVMHSNCLQSLSLSLFSLAVSLSLSLFLSLDDTQMEQSPLRQDAYGASECQIERYFNGVQKSQGDTYDYYRSTRLKSVLSVPILFLCPF